MSVDKSPVYNVRAIPIEKIQANDYNPNVVAPPEMKLLELSIWEDGFTMPCVCYYDEEEDNYILVDGYHRYQVLKTSKRIYQRENGLLPVVVIDKELSNRMASTIRHNRARGTHNIFFFKQKTAYEMLRSLVGSEMCIRVWFNTSRSTIQYRRTSSFELLKKYLEENADEWDEW